MTKQTPAEVAEESRLVKAAEVQLVLIDNIVKNAMKPYKRAVRWLTGIVVALAIGAGVSGFLYANQVGLTHSVQQATISSCNASNTRAAADAGNWSFFMGVALAGNTNAADIAEGRKILMHIEEIDAPIPCTR